MTLFQNKYRIESARLKGWDYSWNGYYFITICIKDHFPLLGEVENGEMRLNQFGQAVHHCWYNLPNHYGNIVLDAFCIMPNHVHGIVVINNDLLNKSDLEKKQHGLFEIIRAFKSFSARRINEIRQSIGTTVWQSRFYDHIIRNDDSLLNIRQYIIENPKAWRNDKFYNEIDN